MEGDGILIIDKDSIDTRDPDAMLLEGWFRARKTTPTLMRWQEGPFRIYTQEGALDVAGGAYVAIDAFGYPYPIASDVYDETYESLESPQTVGDPTIECAHDVGPSPSPSWFGPPPSLESIVHAKNEGLLTEDEAKTAARKMLVAYGLADSGLAAQVDEELERVVVPKGTEIIDK